MIATLLLAATIRVSAAASLMDALGEIARNYKKASIVFNFGASSLLARQIIEGAPADVFISADEVQMDRLGKLIVAPKNILSNALVIVVPADSRLAIRGPDDLLPLHRLALAQPNSVPAGVYAKAWLVKKRLWHRLEGKVIPTENVRAALAAVESGNVDAGIVYATDAAISRKVKIAFRIADGPKILYPAAVLTDSRERAAAQQFLEYLQSDPAHRVFRKYGFLLP